MCEILIKKMRCAVLSEQSQLECIPNESFIGPSKYFSEQALKACHDDFLGERHIEMVYATLVAWGMHRMGKGGAKMPDFDVFKKSIMKNKSTLALLSGLRIENVSVEQLDMLFPMLEALCFNESGIKASTTRSYIVSASKTLAHILPDLVPPIDRQYTATFFGYNKYNISHNQEKELFKKVMETMHTLFQDKEVIRKAMHILKSKKNISLPKLFDNIIIAEVNENK